MDLSGFLLAWRTTALPDREVIDALVHPAHAGPSPALAPALPARRVATILHSGAGRPVVDRHHGRVHSAAHGRVGPPPAARRRRRRADRRPPGGGAGTRDRVRAESSGCRTRIAERDGAGA